MAVIPGISGLATGFMQGQDIARQRQRQELADQQAQQQFDLNMRRGEQDLQRGQTEMDRSKVLSGREDTEYNQRQAEYARKLAARDTMSGVMTAIGSNDHNSAANMFEKFANDPNVNRTGAKMQVKRDAQGLPVITQDAKQGAMLNYVTTGPDGQAKELAMPFDKLPDLAYNAYHADEAYTTDKATKAAAAKDEREFGQKKELETMQQKGAKERTLINEAGANKRAALNEQGANYRAGMIANKEAKKDGGLSAQEKAVIHQALGDAIGATKEADSVSFYLGNSNYQDFVSGMEEKAKAKKAKDTNGYGSLRPSEIKAIRVKADSAYRKLYGDPNASASPAASGMATQQPAVKTIDFSQLRKGQ